MSWTFKLPLIQAHERTPLVEQLLDIIQELKKQLDQTREEVARLRGHKGKPHIKPSRLGQSKKADNKKTKESRLPKTPESPDCEKIIRVENLPEGARFKGYRHYRVQELIFYKETTLYRLERWELSEGHYVTASLPAGISGGHFGPVLQAYVLHQHHHQGVTQPLLLNQLRELKIDISSGQLNNLLIEKKTHFHQEKEELLPAALSVSRYIHVDDTGARHAGKNGYCTHMGNERFAWFESTNSKSRLNFLKLLRHPHNDYVLNKASWVYMRRQKLASEVIKKLGTLTSSYFTDQSLWLSELNRLEIIGHRHIKIATESALIGSLFHHGFRSDMVIMSDDAGQFNILTHILCWFHMERNIHKLMPSGAPQREAVELVRTQIWDLYQRLKAYKMKPTLEEKLKLGKVFDALCQQQTGYQLLNNQLGRIKENRKELLLVLDRPELPLHNNLSERDIREYVKRRKISGSTRSEEGRKCRDTFASLKKTALKLKVSFWEYLIDRITGQQKIPWLPELIKHDHKRNTAPVF